jgi:ABC-type sugar transport system ATPase subunit
MNEILTSRKLSKSYGPTHALRDVSISITQGEKIAILGANGAGKSTLMKVFSGAVQPDNGTMELNGSSYAPKTPNEAIVKGVSTIYQEPFFFPHLSVLENLLMGQAMQARKGLLSLKELTKQASELISQVSLEPKILKKNMSSLSLAEQQLILIARSVDQNVKLLILDEPTTILTDTEASRLFAIVDNLAISGTSICYITHRFDELDRVADRFIVMRDGEISGELQEPDKARILKMMGTETSMTSSRAMPPAMAQESKLDSNGSEMLTVSNLTAQGKFNDVSFTVGSGQIVGFYGLIGSGRTEVAKAIFGELPLQSGSINFKGKPFVPRSARRSMEAGLAYLTEDRKTQGIFKFLSIRENITISIIARLQSFGIIKKPAEIEASNQAVSRHAIKTQDVNNLITSLSGGNQQKVLLARLLISNAELFILDEPTRGIDVKTKSEIHDAIIEVARNGNAVLLITSELPELVRLSDVVHVLRKGEIIASYSNSAINEKDILSSATALSA